MGKLPNTYVVKTGKQGYHIYYISDELISTTSFDFNESHIDIKADRGQVVIEGSEHPETKKLYECHIDSPIINISKQKVLDFFNIGEKKVNNVIQIKKINDKDDKSRSAQEYQQVCSLIARGKTQEEINNHMSIYDKWKHSPEAYRQKTYEKALEFIELSKQQPISPENIKFRVLELFCDTNPNTKATSYMEAEEILVKHLVSKFKFKTIMQDEKFEVWGYEEGIYLPIGQSLARQEIREILGRGFSQIIFNKVINKLTADTYISQDCFFKQEEPYLLPVQNGLLDVRTLELKKFTPDKVFFSKLPIKYNPKSQCPAIIKHLQNVLLEKDDIILLQEAIGNCLLKKYTYQKAVMMVGSGRNGKGITLQLLTYLLGATNTSAITLEQLEIDQFALSGLHGKLANIGGDLNKSSLKNTGVFKSASGGDLISAPRKFMTPIDFENYAKFFFACNELPTIYDDSRGFWDRWLYFEFPYTFIPQDEYDSKKIEDQKNFKIADPKIKEKLFAEEELEGFLNFALLGLKRLLSNNCFSTSITFEAVKRRWRNQSDSFAAFAEFQIIQEYNSEVDKTELKQKYYDYCKSHNIKMMGDRHIYKILSEDYGAEIIQKRDSFNRIRVWTGIKLK